MTLVAVSTEKTRHLALRVKRPGDRQSLSRSATRGLDVMEALAEARGPLRAVDIARMLGLAPSTTNQLLKTMVESAHLLFDARTKTYMPSPRLARLGSWLTEIYGASGRIRDLILDVGAQTGMVVTITTPNDLFMQIIDAVSPSPDTAERGLHVSMFGTAIGSAYLATLDEPEIRRLADRARIPASDLPCILRTLESIREAGYADGPSADTEIWSIAMPLPMRDLRVPAVLGLAGSAKEISARAAELRGIMQRAIAYWLTNLRSQP
jgi:DNA-binding IclR family transcriptional regulator